MEKKNQELSRAVEELSKLIKDTGEGTVFKIKKKKTYGSLTKLSILNIVGIVDLSENLHPR